MLRRDRFELMLWTCGILCAGFALYVSAQTASSSRAADRIAANSSASQDATGSQTPDASGDVIGRIDIPDLHLSAPITADYDPDSLRHGVGHIRGTALPGGLGTVGLAGHRDTFFRPLRNINAKMEIRLIDASGMYRYVIDSTEIVTPDHVEVLDVRNRPALTLVTCYPFDYVGAAPRRFVVHAHLLSVTSEQAASPEAFMR
jgi:sortase A